MKAVNMFVITGNLTRDVEVRYTTGGTAMATYIVAVDDLYYDRQGNKHEETDFIPVTTYGAQAENDAKYLKKGSSVAVTGRIKSWFMREEKRGGMNFKAEQVQYLGRAGGKQAQPAHDDAAAPVDDEWMRDYDRRLQAEQAGAGPMQRQAASR